MGSRRSFFKQTAGLVAAAALAKLPEFPSEPGAVAAPSVPETRELYVEELRGVVSFPVFGRKTMYSIPGTR